MMKIIIIAIASLTVLIILVPIIIEIIKSKPSSLQNIYKTEVQKNLAITENITANIDILSQSDIENLPTSIQQYLRYVGAVEKPKIHNFRAIMTGNMKKSIKSNWMKIHCQQYNFFNPKTRFFFIKASLFGIPFDGLHAYSDNNATMKIRILSYFQIVDASGKKMNQSENVTLFNDMCLLAPATLIDKDVEWEIIDQLTTKAKFTHNNITICATLYFNENYELINFISDDRYLSDDGKTYINYRWSTPITGYKDINGRKIPTSAQAIWGLPEGDFVYAKFNIKEILYNK